MIIYKCLRIILMLFFTVSFTVYSLTAVADTDLENIEKLISQEKYEDAIKQLQVLLSDSAEEDKAEIQNAIGWAYLKLGDYSKAEENLLKSRERALNHGDIETARLATNNLGILKYLQNDLDTSEYYFGQPLNKNTETAKLYAKLIETKRKELLSQEALVSGVKSRRKKDFKAAIKEYDVALKYQPRNAAALEYKGYALLRDGDYQTGCGKQKRCRKASHKHIEDRLITYDGSPEISFKKALEVHPILDVYRLIETE